ncbi:MAG: ADP-ribosylglycohydrolase family protein [Armatimonadota bacterium]|nr:ADP-ribosylglycohydrolase family protein [bacterium]
MNASVIYLNGGIALVGILVLALLGLTARCDQSTHDQQRNIFITNKDEYENKVYGAWCGKLIGLTAGQPVEGWSRQQIEACARKVDAYPVDWFFSADFDSQQKGYLRGNFTSAPSNDDSDFLVVSLLALRKNGINLTSRDIADAWVKYCSAACTAEAVALANFRKGIWPAASAATDNPYSDWIGAQMRSDIWGMIAPGMPDVAADYAERDARISHLGDGIYAERYIAAVISLAMVDTDCKRILREALNVIPADCKYARVVKDVLNWHEQSATWSKAWDLLDAKYGLLEDGSRVAPFAEEKYKTGLYANWCNMKWVHADINGGAVALALLYGNGDFTKTVSLGVMCGYDCDCNAGTVGAILGAMWGERAIPTKWKASFNDTYNTDVKIDNQNLKISELAKETAGYGLQVLDQRNSTRTGQHPTREYMHRIGGEAW